MSKKFKEQPDKIKIFGTVDQNGKLEIILSVVKVNIGIFQSSSHFKVWSSFFDSALVLCSVNFI